jgi:uncharacterized protein (DUF1499 family)
MFLGWLIAVAGLCFVLIRFSGLLDEILSPGEPAHVSVSPDMPLPDSPKFFVICLPKACPATSRHLESPLFPVGAGQLFARLEEVVADYGGKIKVRDGSNFELSVVARTPVMHFPDWVYLKAVPAGENHSYLAAYGVSVYGAGDFGTNRKRLEKWLAALQAMTGAKN